MSARQVRIIAIGGGGCTHRADAEMDIWIRGLVNAKRPRFGFLGTASEDQPAKLDGFRASYSQHGAVLEAPPLASSPEIFAGWLGQLDLVYVGGGHTRFLLERWCHAGWGEPLAAAARNGLLLAGVSAGGVCLFDVAFSDSGGNGYAPLAGLGLVPGSCCPHYSEEPARQPAYEGAVAEGRIAPGIAIDDGVAVLCDANGAKGFMSARPGCAAYRIGHSEGKVVRARLPSLTSA
jgi:dipeptidase E